jgi:CRISPR-associated protein Cmr1
MTSRIPKPPERRLCRQPSAGPLGTEILHLETATPLFGGGPRARTVDRHTPIRVPGIRGQVRFWWRALSALDSSEELAKRERELFGGVFGDSVQRSRVDIWISEVTPSEIQDTDVNHRTTGAYALWPAAENKRQQQAPGERWQEGLRFRLHVRASEEALNHEIVPALRAWLWFGGVGGRTRRGCGSLTVIEDQARWLPPALTWQELDRLLSNRGVLEPSTAQARRDMPSLRGAALYSGNQSRDASHCWTQALAWLKDFRQAAPRPSTPRPDEFARHAGQGNKPGRSNWPEPDKIRRLAPLERGKSWAHAPRHNQDPAWPRAGFGLPIIGKFVSTRNSRYVEPPNFQLKWHDHDGPHERLASPLIVKAMPLAGGQFVPIALWLHRRYPEHGQVVLLLDGKSVERSGASFDKLAGKGETPAYAALRGKRTLEQAFCDWLVKEKRVQAVKPGSKR